MVVMIIIKDSNDEVMMAILCSSHIGNYGDTGKVAMVLTVELMVDINHSDDEGKMTIELQWRKDDNRVIMKERWQ